MQQVLSNREKEYPRYMWYFIGSFIGLLTLFNIISITFKVSHRRLRSLSVPSDPERHLSSPGHHDGGLVALRRLPSALANTYRILAYRGTINITRTFSVNLAEVQVCVIYTVALFAFESINATSSDGSQGYWRARAGTLATSQIPLIVALGMKNNVISLLTGIGYEKLSFIHRMISRVVFVLLCVHAAGGGDLDTGRPDTSGLGIMALVAFAYLIFIVSNRYVRGRFYEVFYYGHFVLVLLFLGGAYYHANGETFGYYIWPCFLLWGLDRLIRLIRVVAFNRSSFSSSEVHEMDASIKLVTPDIVRLTMKRPPPFSWAPGQFVYLHAPTVAFFPGEAHPFTIASHKSLSISTSNSFELQNLPSQAGPGISASSQNDDSESQEAVLRSLYRNRKEWRELIFFINVHGGFTKRLRETAKRKKTIKVLLDGPYGFPISVDTFDTIVLIAGGTGVTFTLPIFSDAILRVGSSKSRCKQLTFVWSVRDPGKASSSHILFFTFNFSCASILAHLDLISPTLISLSNIMPPYLKVRVYLFVSSTGENKGPPLSFPESIISNDVLRNIVSVSTGRADLRSILEEEIEQTRGGAVCVAVCGSQSIARDVRKGLGFSVGGLGTIMRGGASVTLHTETFGYA